MSKQFKEGDWVVIRPEQASHLADQDYLTSNVHRNGPLWKIIDITWDGGRVLNYQCEPFTGEDWCIGVLPHEIELYVEGSNDG